MVPAPYDPVDFPASANGKTFEFRKDGPATYTISRAGYQELYRRGCVDVHSVPAMDLGNPIHILFRQNAFQGITNRQYNFIRPALTLASRFIMEDAYMGYWAHLCSADPVKDNLRTLSPMETEKGTVLQPDREITDNEAVTMARTAFSEMSESLTFFFSDDQYFLIENAGVKDSWAAESFTGDIHRDCRYNTEVNNGCQAGHCGLCDSSANLRCGGCGGTQYEKKSVKELQAVVQARGIQSKARNPRHLIHALERHDELTDGVPSQEACGLVPNRDGMANLQIGLKHNIEAHIDRATAAVPQDRWTQSEEIRFQFSIAATLCHELAHVFWWWTQRRCVLCEGDEPWWSADEDKRYGVPELGIDWEWWAFGCTVPATAKIQQDVNKDSPNMFSRSTWCQTYQTKDGGFCANSCVRYSYIVPVEWTNSWFRKSIWANIRINGREAGRPSHGDLVIMSELGAKRADDDTFVTFECDIEAYSHPQLVAQGGFEKIKFLTSDEKMLEYTRNLFRKKGGEKGKKKGGKKVGKKVGKPNKVVKNKRK